MTSYAMLIDVDRCTGCYNCFLSCKDEFCGNDFPGYSAAQPEFGQFWLNMKEVERGSFPKVKVDYTPIPCMQCKNPPCVKAAVDDAAFIRDDGIIIIDPIKAKGQRDIAHACPYRVIYWNEEEQLPQKCTFCAHLLDKGWKVPRCVESCPTDAKIFGDLDDPNSEVSKLKASGKYEQIRPEFNTAPKVLYANLPKRFISGEVLLANNKDECAQGVKVVLEKDGSEVASRETDLYGDFEFDGLEKAYGYTVKIDHSGYASVTLDVDSKIDVHLGEIELMKA
ncbi:MAG: oxidoreductase [Proteobacteria bacterium]|nr:oxidoreductase [Pseudomonadota bacterium]